MSRLVLIALAALFLSGCYTHRITVGSGGGGWAAQTSTDWYFLGGLIGGGNLNISAICPSGNATVVVEQTLVDSCIAGILGGCAVPQTTKVYCGEKSAALEDQEVEKLLAQSDLEERLIEAIRARGY